MVAGARVTAEQVAVTIAFLSLGISGYQAFVQEDDRTRTAASLAVDAKVRNITAGQRPSGGQRTSQPSDAILYETRVTNLGERPATNVELRLGMPPADAGEYVPRSCRIARGRRARTCDSAAQGPPGDLMLGDLEGGESVSVSYRFEALSPPCEGYWYKAAPAVDSDETATQGEEVWVFGSTATNTAPACDSPAGKLRTYAPRAFRDTCTSTTNSVGSPRAALDCKPGGGVPLAQYVLYSTEAATKRAFNGRVREIPPRIRRPCARSTVRRYTQGGEIAGRVMCWVDSHSGNAWIEWTHTRLRVYAYARRSDGGIRRLYQWWLDEGGPYG